MEERLAIVALAAALAAQGQVFLDEKKAADIVLRGCAAIEREEKTVTPEDRAQIEKISGLRVPIPRYTFLVCRNGEVSRYAVIMDETGKSEPITFLVGVESSGKAGEIALMVFRESRGWEVREPRFTRQFKGKKLEDPIRVNQDVMNYTGATLSSEAMARGVKKALALVRHYYLEK
jgi:Na+-translocating ferredoxin:NAD+ oxidoreductase RnfG subunit